MRRDSISSCLLERVPLVCHFRYLPAVSGPKDAIVTFPITALSCSYHILDMVTWLNQHIWHWSLSFWWKATVKPSPHCRQILPIAGEEHNTRLECPFKYVKPRAKNTDKTALVIWGGQISSSNSESVRDWRLSQSNYQKPCYFQTRTDWNLENCPTTLWCGGLGIKLSDDDS